MPESNYALTKRYLLNNYAKCRILAFQPLSIRFGLLGGRNKSFSFASLLITIPLTIVTVSVAAIGALANTAYGAIMLPWSLRIDKNTAELFTVATKSEILPSVIVEPCHSLTSTEVMLQNMPCEERTDSTEVMRTHEKSPTEFSEDSDYEIIPSPQSCIQTF